MFDTVHPWSSGTPSEWAFIPDWGSWKPGKLETLLCQWKITKEATGAWSLLSPLAIHECKSHTISWHCKQGCRGRLSGLSVALLLNRHSFLKMVTQMKGSSLISIVYLLERFSFRISMVQYILCNNVLYWWNPSQKLCRHYL